MSPEQLEFVLTQYLDGTLPPEQVGALEERLASDATARALRDAHERLTALLRSQSLPEADWDDLARDLAAVVTGTVDEADRAADQRLNAILRSAPPLPAIRWAELSARISGAVDAEIEGAGAEDQRLASMFRAQPLPNVNWDRLSTHLSSALDAEAGAAEQVGRPAVAGRITEEVERPAVAGRIGWVRTASRLAMAACVIVAASLGIRFYNQSHVGPRTGPSVGPVAVAVKPVSIVETPQVEVASAAPVDEISIGPSNAYAESSDADLYRRGVAARSPVVIALPAASEDDASDHVPMFE